MVAAAGRRQPHANAAEDEHMGRDDPGWKRRHRRCPAERDQHEHGEADEGLDGGDGGRPPHDRRGRGTAADTMHGVEDEQWVCSRHQRRALDRGTSPSLPLDRRSLPGRIDEFLPAERTIDERIDGRQPARFNKM